jgi:hypothetical protein
MTQKRWPLSFGELYFVAAGPVCIIVAIYALSRGYVRGIVNEAVLAMVVFWVAWPFISWVSGGAKPDATAPLDHES